MIPTTRTPSMANAHCSAGFTLLEMLVVVFILAILAGSAMIVYDGIAEDAQIAVAQAEMAELKKALLRFRQDTGYLPRQTTGPFIYENIPDDHFPSSVPEGQRQAWFDSEYNFWLLYGRDDVADDPSTPVSENCPLNLDDPALRKFCTWDPNTNHGWRGPYLTRHAEGLVDVPDEFGDEIQNVRGVADPFVAGPDCDTIPGTCVFDWRPTAESPDRPRWGRPYALRDVDGSEARIVSLGPNGVREDSDDSEDMNADPCIPNDGSDDLVLCLLQ